MSPQPDVAPRVVVVDHHDSYTWNLVHLLASVTGELPEVVQHDATSVAHLLSCLLYTSDAADEL